jgi:hypothetical protein
MRKSNVQDVKRYDFPVVKIVESSKVKNFCAARRKFLPMSDPKWF